MKPQDSQIHFCAVVVSLMGRKVPFTPWRSTVPRPARSSTSTGEETVPRQAATVIVLRGGADALEVLLVQRTPQARFMGGVWVFPGGAVDAAEGDGDAAHRVAAVRELEEEAGIVLDDPGALVKFSRWITPAEVVIRFDTHFFLAPLPDGQEPPIDGDEIVDQGWFTPAAALDAHERGEIALVFPTIKHLEQLGGLRQRRRAARLRPRPRRRPGGAARRDRGRDGAPPAARRARLRRLMPAPATLRRRRD